MNEPPDLTPQSGEVLAKIGTGIISSIPGVGGLLAASGQILLDTQQADRVRAEFRRIDQRFDDLEGQIDEKYLRSSQFRDAAVEIFRKMTEEREEELLEAYGNLFVTAAVSEVEYRDVTEISRLLQGWGARHVLLLRLLYDPSEVHRAAGSPLDDTSTHDSSMVKLHGAIAHIYPGWESEARIRTWVQLQRDRLVVQEELHDIELYFDDEYDREDVLTEFGIKVARLLRDRGTTSN